VLPFVLVSVPVPLLAATTLRLLQLYCHCWQQQQQAGQPGSTSTSTSSREKLATVAVKQHDPLPVHLPAVAVVAWKLISQVGFKALWTLNPNQGPVSKLTVYLPAVAVAWLTALL